VDRPKADRLLALALLLVAGCRPADSSAPSPALDMLRGRYHLLLGDDKAN